MRLTLLTVMQRPEDYSSSEEETLEKQDSLVDPDPEFRIGDKTVPEGSEKAISKSAFNAGKFPEVLQNFFICYFPLYNIWPVTSRILILIFGRTDQCNTFLMRFCLKCSKSPFLSVMFRNKRSMPLLPAEVSSSFMIILNLDWISFLQLKKQLRSLLEI